MNVPINFATNPSTIFLVTDRQTHTETHRQTHKPTPVKTYSLAFAGRIIMQYSTHGDNVANVQQKSKGTRTKTKQTRTETDD